MNAAPIRGTLMEMRGLLLVVLLGVATSCSSAPTRPAGESRTIAIPGTQIRFDMVYVPGGQGLRPFWIGKREVTWGDFAAFHGTKHRRGERVDGVTYPSETSYLEHAWGASPHVFGPS